MIAICGWCTKYLHGHGDSDDGISHGMCPECRRKALDDLDEEDTGPHRAIVLLPIACALFWIAVAAIIWFAWRQG
jgi:hypothetical protein